MILQGNQISFCRPRAVINKEQYSGRYVPQSFKVNSISIILSTFLQLHNTLVIKVGSLRDKSSRVRSANIAMSMFCSKRPYLTWYSVGFVFERSLVWYQCDRPDLGFLSVFLSHTRHVPWCYLQFKTWLTSYRISQNLISEWIGILVFETEDSTGCLDLNPETGYKDPGRNGYPVPRTRSESSVSISKIRVRVPVPILRKRTGSMCSSMFIIN